MNWDFEVAMFGTQFLQQMESVHAQLFSKNFVWEEVYVAYHLKLDNG